MSVQEKQHREAARQREPDELFHYYPCTWGPFGEDLRMARPGDIAICGYVKRGPAGGCGEWGRSDACIVCEALSNCGRRR